MSAICKNVANGQHIILAEVVEKRRYHPLLTMGERVQL